MGRELQKKKNRSGISKARIKPKSKKRHLTNPIIAANWSQHETLVQNYKRLGLTVKLNKNTGGVERKLSDILAAKDGNAADGQNEADGLTISATRRRGEKLEVREAKIERDAKTGKILRVVGGDEEDEDGQSQRTSKQRRQGLDDPLNELDSDSEEEFFSLDNQHGNVPSAANQESAELEGGQTETVKQLEAAARRPAAKYVRRQPEGEVAFIEELVRKHGDDYGKMARDMKINYMQRSEGDLKKRIKKWKAAGGSVD